MPSTTAFSDSYSQGWNAAGYQFRGRRATAYHLGATRALLRRGHRGRARIWYAISRDGLLPGWFAKTNARHSPSRPVWIVGITSAGIAGLVPIGDAAELTNIGILLAFVVVSAAVIVLRYRSPELPRTFRTPFMPVTPLLGIAFSLWLVSKLQPLTWVRFLTWFILGAITYATYGYRHSKLGQGEVVQTDDT